jgi:hypothetical protein
MKADPFAFLRGAAAIMAADLATMPATGLRVQSCGDCHLANFGSYATPEGTPIFDINDFDETLPAPFEWDLKRLAASLVTPDGSRPCRTRQPAARAHGRAELPRASGPFGAAAPLDAWNTRIDLATALGEIDSTKIRRRLEKRLAAVLAGDAEHFGSWKEERQLADPGQAAAGAPSEPA